MDEARSGTVYESLSRLIDHAVLRPTSTIDDLVAGCRLAVGYRVASICILPYFVPRAAELLAELDDGHHGVALSTVIGFPHGAHATETKVAEAITAMREGARELDMVMNLSLAKSHQWNGVSDDIRAVVDAAHERDCLVKVILETSELSESEVRRACDLCNEISPDWVKTSTGFASGGASLEAVTLMRQCVDESIGVKASGGIRDLETALAYREAGASRLGTSSTVAILDDWATKA